MLAHDRSVLEPLPRLGIQQIGRFIGCQKWSSPTEQLPDSTRQTVGGVHLRSTSTFMLTHLLIRLHVSTDAVAKKTTIKPYRN
jgi:hypothetical protein